MFAFGGALVALAATPGFLMVKERLHAKKMSGDVAMAVQTVVEDHCVPFLDAWDGGKADHFDGTGLIVLAERDGHPQFSNTANSLRVTLRLVDNQNASCLVESVRSRWTDSDRANVEDYATALGLKWVAEPAKFIDLREKTGFSVHRVFRPKEETGRFVMIATTELVPGSFHTFLNVGRAAFEEDNDV
ncbi:hypothetical protein [uncultured Tateyamaria sp.]|uniref:hypothetical protein n=2 Tax=uncultured Tateyamaria sp. TaxID=455651 RepID=UPI002639929A|nr:hypothetical protein [uncultured Tateyamaria sp.]